MEEYFRTKSICQIEKEQNKILKNLPKIIYIMKFIEINNHIKILNGIVLKILEKNLVIILGK